MNAFALKLLALAAMCVDHTGAVFYPTGVLSQEAYMLMREIGRLAFPIYCFFIAEGSRRTRNFPRYIGRLALFAFISEVPFDLTFASEGLFPARNVIWLEFGHQNVFFTLALGAAAIYAYELLRKKEVPVFIAALVPLAAAFLAEALRTDYGLLGIVLIFALYLCPTKPLQTVVVAAWAVLMNVYIFSSWSVYGFRLLLWTAAAAIPLLLYNGKKGPSFKWAFYIAYPAHMLILTGLLYFVSYR